MCVHGPGRHEALNLKGVLAMRKWITVAIVLLMSGGTSLFSQDLEQILSRNFETRGGLKKLNAVKTIKCVGDMVMAKRLKCPLTAWRKAPDKMKLESRVMGNLITQGYDGKVLWWINPQAGVFEPEKMVESEMDEFVETLRPLFMHSLVEYKKAGDKLDVVGKEKLEGSEVYKLKLTDKEGKATFFYLDEETGIELKMVTRVESGNGYTQYERILGDYKEVDGILFPFSIEVHFTSSNPEDKLDISITLKKITLNAEIKDSFFEMKEKKKEEGDEQ